MYSALVAEKKKNQISHPLWVYDRPNLEKRVWYPAKCSYAFNEFHQTGGMENLGSNQDAV